MGIQVKRLLTGNGTLYSEKSSNIAKWVEDKLRELAEAGLEILDIEAVPDYHNWGADGGVKDIFFLCRDSSRPQPTWHTTIVIRDDETLHGDSTANILGLLDEAVRRLEASGHVVCNIIMLTDYHASSIFEGVGGLDGVKNIILCYN